MRGCSLRMVSIVSGVVFMVIGALPFIAKSPGEAILPGEWVCLFLGTLVGTWFVTLALAERR